ncbi:MAG: excinuclease ABC subunit UvrC [Reichenbachiella sp.]
MKASEEIIKSIQSLPNDPGVYKYYNIEDQLIYVGKAKNLKKRVSSYFNKQSGVSLKTKKLVKEIIKIEFVVVNSEFDALLLENNLIKENQPRFNILLKDDKSFPFICVSNERFPKVYSTRRHDKNEGQYFGPYTNLKAMYNVLELLQKLYTIRTCNFTLSQENIEAKKFKVCLEYHIGNCQGPCENLQKETPYLSDIEHTKHILKGNLRIVKDHFTNKMVQASTEMSFEDAQLYKEKIDLLDKFQSKTIIVNKNMKDVDVITISTTEDKAYINYMRIDNGMINISDTVSIKKKLEESNVDLMLLLAIEMRNKFNSTSRTILTNQPFPSWDENIQIIEPKIGDKKSLIALSIKNALYLKKQSIDLNNQQKEKSNRVVSQLQTDLQLKELPIHIECFDNSNISGTNPVASMVCFRNGKPAKKDYRHYKIKTVIGPDDFGSMTEIVRRRYKRLSEENKTFPQLIVIDGGKGQLSAACDALKELGIYGEIPIIGIAKRLEEIYYPEDSIPLHISKKSTSLKLIQQLRDEAHRFAITFHRNLRSNAQITSELDEIAGIGEKTKTKLLTHYKSYKKIEESTLEELTTTVGLSKANIVFQHIKKGLS